MSQPGDPYEREADRVAATVMNSSNPAIQEGEARTQQLRPLSSRLQRQVQAAGQTASSPVVNEVLRSPGEPLDPATRAFMEPRFGHDFGPVRVHRDAKAAESAAAVSARAYAVGPHVVFGADQYAPDRQKGRRLLAHELAHVVQQSGGNSGGSSGKGPAGAIGGLGPMQRSGLFLQRNFVDGLLHTRVPDRPREEPPCEPDCGETCYRVLSHHLTELFPAPHYKIKSVKFTEYKCTTNSAQRPRNWDWACGAKLEVTVPECASGKGEKVYKLEFGAVLMKGWILAGTHHGTCLYRVWCMAEAPVKFRRVQCVWHRKFIPPNPYC